MEQGKVPSSILSFPYLTVHQVHPDWLHTVDVGVAADFLGGAFLFVVREGLEAGASHRERLKSLWLKLQAWYQKEAVTGCKA
eukprot:86604-Amphidinium_carterae.1